MKAVWLEQALASVIKSTFPISVVSLTGEQVILSQGGKAVKTGQKYALVFLGADIKDPQTGASLGPVKTACCDVVIDQVMPNISYGHLENIAIDLNKINPQSLQLGSPIKSSLVVSESTKADSNKQGVEKNQAKTQQKNKSSQDLDIKPNAAQPHSNKADEIKEDGKW
jgi:hypothetical protein